MATIRDLVSTLRRRDGVDAAIVLGRDGLLIDGATEGALDPEGLAAHVPPMVIAAADMGLASGRGEFGLMVLEYGAGTAVVCVRERESPSRLPPLRAVRACNPYASGSTQKSHAACGAASGDRH